MSRTNIDVFKAMLERAPTRDLLAEQRVLEAKEEALRVANLATDAVRIISLSLPSGSFTFC
jgi:hypothetical protein